MIDKVLESYRIFDRLAATRKPCTIVADQAILDAIRSRQDGEGARMIPVAHVMKGKDFTPQPGPYFVLTEKDEHLVKRRLRDYLARCGLRPEIFGALHDLTPMIAAEANDIEPGGLEVAYEALLTRPAFVIVCTPRSGSQHLARELRNHGFGQPLEHVRPQVIDMMRLRPDGTRPGGFDLVHWMASLVRYGTLSGVFGTKLISHFLRDIDTHATRAEQAVLDAFLRRVPVIYLLRGNKMMQALSRDRAKATRSYHLFDEDKRDRYLEKSNEWDYSFDRIAREIQSLYQEECYLLERIRRIVPAERRLLIEYEGLEVRSAVAFLESQLRIAETPQQARLATNVLRDDLTLDYAARFCADYAAAFRPDDPGTHLPHGVRIEPAEFLMSVATDPAALRPI
jgi:LPS sulfotransferase NodH